MHVDRVCVWVCVGVCVCVCVVRVQCHKFRMISSGDLDMDLTSRAKLNNFGLVQHAVLESPDRITVRVIYGYTDRDFVHTELIKELETRTGLQLVPPQSPVATRETGQSCNKYEKTDNNCGPIHGCITDLSLWSESSRTGTAPHQTEDTASE